MLPATESHAGTIRTQRGSPAAMSDSFPKAMPHDPLERIFDDAWYVTGTVMLKPLVRLIRNMVVLRHEGELTLINPVRLTPEGEAELTRLGKITHLVSLGGHAMDNPYYVDRHGAKVWSVRPSAGATVLTEGGPLPLPGVQLFRFRDSNQPEGALLVERDGGLLITCDAVQHWAPHPLMSAGARLITWLLGFHHPAQLGPPWRKVMTPPGGSLRPDFERLAALPFESLIGGHGGLLRSDAATALRASIERNYPQT